MNSNYTANIHTLIAFPFCLKNTTQEMYEFYCTSFMSGILFSPLSVPAERAVCSANVFSLLIL